ncbi:discoidin, CUB and LCCL domain-containing protein 1-like [Protopterus annectens]|uniref:discoidin, CUB and LCCL domain-containing protein 1-like n=1 Tax=Protopterus annectens TaxID=7888 RepID=UPI001CFAE288|nr:discoidin, CUB and LCCL domain-containing protein 1-like [Protopterus annectens]
MDLKSSASRNFLSLGVLLMLVRGATCGRNSVFGGNGCGHTIVSTQSGTLASRNYPGTYPNQTECEWKVNVAPFQGIKLVFGDFDVEHSDQCKSGSVSVTVPFDGRHYGPYCGSRPPDPKILQINSSEVVVWFNSSIHRSGRGFLMSYAVDEHPDLVSCLSKGTHYSKQQFSVYCPAGCKNINGDIWGDKNSGYRDTSVLCKAAIHAGVISDEAGGQISVVQKKGITLYESAFANGIWSKTGSLSEKLLIFQKDCDNIVEGLTFSASSSWQETNIMGQQVTWSANRASHNTMGYSISWAAQHNMAEEWLQIDLQERKNITGIITQGSNDREYDFYVKSFRILFSKDGINWKTYKTSSTNYVKEFESNTDNQKEVRNNFIPSIVSRFIRISPQSWNQRIAMKVKLLGCQPLRPRSLRPNENINPTSFPEVSSTFTENTTFQDPVIIRTVPGPALLPILITGGLVILLTAIVLFAFMCRKKRKAEGGSVCTFTKGCPTVIKPQNCYQTQLRSPVCEMIVYPEDGELSRELCRQQLPDYAELDISQVGSCGQKVPSTFKPSADEGYTVPLISHYDVPGKHHEYAEPLPSEAEYATPFGEQQVESTAAARKFHSPRYPQIPEEIRSQYDSVFQVTGIISRGYTEAPLDLSSGYAEPQINQTTEVNNVTYRQESNGSAFDKETYSQPKDSVTHVYHEVL